MKTPRPLAVALLGLAASSSSVASYKPGASLTLDAGSTFPAGADPTGIGT